jgi:hypothetical protein
MHCREQPRQPKKVISVKMRDQYELNFLELESELAELLLCAFSAVNENVPFIAIEVLSGSLSFACG